MTANRALVELTTEEQTRVDTSPGMTLLPSSLLELNCLLLLPQMLACRAQQGRRVRISYAEIIEALLTAGFHIIGLRMLLLGVAEAADCAKLYSGCLPADWKPHHLVSTEWAVDFHNCCLLSKTRSPRSLHLLRRSAHVNQNDGWSFRQFIRIASRVAHAHISRAF